MAAKTDAPVPSSGAPAAPLPNRLREHRKARGMTQGDLAAHLDVEAGYISRLERGERRPSIEIATRIAELLGVRIDDIFNQDVSNPPSGGTAPLPLRSIPIISWEDVMAVAQKPGIRPPLGSTGEVAVTGAGRAWYGVVVRHPTIDRVAAVGSVAAVDFLDRDLLEGHFFLLAHAGTLDFRRYTAEGGPARLEAHSTQAAPAPLFDLASVRVLGRLAQVSVLFPRP